MRTKSILLAVGLAAMLLLAGCTSSLAPGNAAAAPEESDAQPARSITVGAAGTAETSPDQVVVRVAVAVTGDDASQVRERLAENASRLRAALADAGLEDDQIRTRHYDIDRDRERRPREGDGKGEAALTYRGVHAFEVTLSNVSRAGEVIDIAVANGASRVDDVRFTLSEETRRDLRERALADAMANARSQAETLAAEGGLSVEGVRTVETTERGHSPVRTTAAAADAGGATGIDTGPVTVRTQVRVTYDATEA